MSGELLGYVLIETHQAEGREAERTVALTVGAPYRDAETAERERLRAQAHADLDADMFPGYTFAVGEVRAP